MSRGGYRFFCIFFILLTASIERAGASKRRRLIVLISVDWVPPYLRPSGACLDLGTRVCCSLLTPSRVAPHRGCVSSDERSQSPEDGYRAFSGLGLWSQRYLLGDGPHEGDQCPNDGHHHLIGMFAAGAQFVVAV